MERLRPPRSCRFSECRGQTYREEDDWMMKQGRSLELLRMRAVTHSTPATINQVVIR
jgi:hypothetical protein